MPSTHPNHQPSLQNPANASPQGRAVYEEAEAERLRQMTVLIFKRMIAAVDASGSDAATSRSTCEARSELLCLYETYLRHTQQPPPYSFSITVPTADVAFDLDLPADEDLIAVLLLRFELAYAAIVVLEQEDQVKKDTMLHMKQRTATSNQTHSETRHRHGGRSLAQTLERCHLRRDTLKRTERLLIDAMDWNGYKRDETGLALLSHLELALAMGGDTEWTGGNIEQRETSVTPKGKEGSDHQHGRLRPLGTRGARVEV
ncbi:hypothetical protein PENSPDRAFT_662487 [Peniophora sp. CONT]|nr:hypothetical protein PENSPDRAFT_662487 [Peniophora sp. CONT]